MISIAAIIGAITAVAGAITAVVKINKKRKANKPCSNPHPNAEKK